MRLWGRARALLVAIATAAVLAPASAGAAPRLVADLSQSRIDIEYSFAGAELLVFGAIQYPGGRTPRDEPAIAVIVRGPPEAITVRRKEKIAGIWLNTTSARFETAPGFYAVATSAPVRDLVDERTAAIYEIGLDHLQLSPGSSNSPELSRLFVEGLLDLRRRAGLYAENDSGVDLREGVLYQARIAIPSAVPVGRYTAEIHLIQNGKVLASATRDIRIGKSGFEQAVFVAAQEHEIAYGLGAVAIALLAGWAAGAVVRR